ncbi:unnamed protein product [Brachionus calyciflorus]|uniref:Uncharacterized protein n=1 Tax=Brachionus calyciflorus TaxID=104777 RepID=A0A813RWF1_9BILA|nr:unnamed protein product [Brachionus calyciflorus]
MFSIKKLKALVKELLDKLKRAGWTINREKSVLKPSSRLGFLGANWDEEGVERTKEASDAIWQLLKEVTLKDFPLEKDEEIDSSSDLSSSDDEFDLDFIC